MNAEAELVRKAQQGCEAAFGDLVQRFAERLHRFLVARGTSPDDAEDLVQETFIAAYQALDRYDERFAFSTWLFTIGRRLAVSHFRKRKRHGAINEHLPAREAATAEEAGQGIWEHARTVLPERDYEALWLRYGEGLATAEIAKVLGVHSLHARVILHRARSRLAQELGAAATAGAAGLAPR